MRERCVAIIVHFRFEHSSPTHRESDLGISEAAILKIPAFRTGTLLRTCDLREGGSLLTADNAGRRDIARWHQSGMMDQGRS
jgi:hypothetical protein